ncbi:hypothetical protein JOF56_003745 [Kibdelosporangium banguiense]|uniref:Uncharacterized protein n=1 Tax=Kibdelosporangium banguiense TaxID=1365924 RepID=A0ABS4TH56_9PSEU|nr:hypothetical protein [Kibdelosporangium banguiense]MBP2323360.1 hypothetical protein [Kibdelosporangium banguiense]
MEVRTYVHVRSHDGAKSAVLKPGDTVPDWAEVTNRAALLDAPEAAAPKEVAEPATEGPAVEDEKPTPKTSAPKATTRRKPAARATESKTE